MKYTIKKFLNCVVEKHHHHHTVLVVYIVCVRGHVCVFIL